MSQTGDWKRIKDLFLQALERGPREREALLRGTGDPLIAAEVSSLLVAHEASEGFIEKPRVMGHSGLLEAITGSWAVGRNIGRYQVLRQLGRGSLGSVFQARDLEGGVDVALELLAPEVQAALGEAAIAELVTRIGGLDHAHVARLLAIGRTPDGLSYLIAEYVRGIPLPQYADRQTLGIRQRLQLFWQLAAGVAAAQRQGLVHGDIKPRNALVADGGLKLIDLGLSSLLATPARAVLGVAFPAVTTPYTSPEQVQGVELTAASDAYSLGALLYELLAGQPPHGAAVLSPETLKRAILGSPPPPPSATAAQAVAPGATGGGAAISPAELAARRGTDPSGLAAELASLDALVLRLLSREPAARPSAEELVGELERRLAGPQ